MYSSRVFGRTRSANGSFMLQKYNKVGALLVLTRKGFRDTDNLSDFPALDPYLISKTYEA